MDEEKAKELIRKSYDMHFHIGPDILPRKYTVEQLIAEEKGNIGGLVLKSHSFPTIALIDGIRQDPELDLIGSITLNYFMGGFNQSAIYASSVMSGEQPIVVWLPTIHAENHLVQNKSKYEIPPEWIKDPTFKPRYKDNLRAIKVTDWAENIIRKMNECLETMAEMKCVLATGHVSWQEAERVALAALDMGIPTIITHPMQRDIAMPLDVQVKLAEKGAYIEYCHIMYLDRDNPGDYPLAEQVVCMEEIGADKLVISSDAGQCKNPKSSESLGEFIGLLADNGMDEDVFETILVKNPKKILGL